jgi:hypothetical protein
MTVLGSGLLVASCAGSGGTEVPENGLSVQIVSARQLTTLSFDVAPYTLTSAPGEYFARLDLSLHNTGAERVSINPALFMIETLQGVQQAIDGATGLLVEGCEADAYLAPGGSTSCSLVFSLKDSETPSYLLHAFPGSAETARYPIANWTLCDRCDGVCVDLQFDAMNCGACGRLTPTGATCVQGQPMCIDPENAICADEYGAESCVNLLDDMDHCGLCGRSCPGGNMMAGCTSGRCRVAYYQPRSCSSVCQQWGLLCTGTDHELYCRAGAGSYSQSGLTFTCDQVPQGTAGCEYGFILCLCG